MFDFLIHSPVGHFARMAPMQPAFSCKGEELSYADLEAASNQLARALIAKGLRPQDRVGIFMHKRLELGPAIYGALKAGGVFVPLDPFMPVERLAFILEDCGIRHLVTTDDKMRTLGQLDPATELSLFGVKDSGAFAGVGPEELAAYPSTPPEGVALIDQDLGYIMYTSGSTGQPKGMMHSHHGSISYARWGAQHVGLTAADRVASHAPLHFDLSIFDFFSTVQVGATVVLVPEPVTKFAASWSGYVESERVSVVFTVPFTLIEMLRHGAMEERDLSSLRWILFGGEPFPPKHLAELMGRLPDVRFTNVYGPAEAPSCTCYDVPAPPADDADALPIGELSVNSRGLILDDDDQPCAVGEVGELCIRSSTLTKGYWKRPDLNERVYLYRPSPGPFPERWFRTGDLVMRHQDGQLRFLGRKDRMVKTRGHRVELDEVEAALSSHEAVAEAAAFAVPDGRGSKAIHAVVTLGDGTDATAIDSAAILRHARTKIPTYAIPEHLDIVDDLPHTSSGKIDRKKLAENHTPPA